MNHQPYKVSILNQNEFKLNSDWSTVKQYNVDNPIARVSWNNDYVGLNCTSRKFDNLSNTIIAWPTCGGEYL